MLVLLISKIEVKKGLILVDSNDMIKMGIKINFIIY